MKTNSKRLDDYIRQIEIRNKDLAADNLRGLSIATVSYTHLTLPTTSRV